MSQTEEDPLCIHEQPRDYCAICKDRAKWLASKQPDTVEHMLLARFESLCLLCREPIQAGEYIAKLTPSGRYVHRECAP